jgi:hypothetical protein
VIGPELIFGTLYDHIEYGAIDNNMFKHLVICRLFNLGSKLKTVEYLGRYLHVSYSVDSIYRFLDELCIPRKKDADNGGRPGMQAAVESILYAYTKMVIGGDVPVCFYDMTTLYFKTSEENELRRYGFSKDVKNTCPRYSSVSWWQRAATPIGYGIFEENTSESRTLLTVVRKLAGEFGFDKHVVVADSGLLTKGNMTELERDGYQYILGARPKMRRRPSKARYSRSICRMVA